jgi:hypothetical protein
MRRFFRPAFALPDFDLKTTGFVLNLLDFPDDTRFRRSCLQYSVGPTDWRDHRSM